MSLKRTRRFELLGDVADRLLAASSTEAVLDAAVEAGTDVLGADAATVFLAAGDPAIEADVAPLDGRYGSPVAVDVPDADDVVADDGTTNGTVDDARQGAISIPDGPSLWPVATGRTAVNPLGAAPTRAALRDAVADAYGEDGEARRLTIDGDPTDGGGVRSLVIAPVGNRGIVAYASTVSNAFDEVDRRLTARIGSLVGRALDRADRERRLRRENERLSTFASAVSHDLKNPLSVAAGYLELELARRGSSDGDGEAGSEDGRNLRAISDAISRATGIVDDLLVLARTPAVDADETVRLDEAVTDAWSDVDAPDDRLWIDPAVGSIRCESGLLRQLLVNLLSNAVDHGEPGCEVRVRALPDGFAVENDGEPVPAGTRSAVFEPGRSGDRGGTGLGLAVVRQVADAHDWSVAATESDAGDARFEVTGVETV